MGKGNKAGKRYKEIEKAQKEGKSYFVYSGFKGTVCDHEILPDEILVPLYDYKNISDNVQKRKRTEYRVSSKGNVYHVRKGRKELGEDPNEQKVYVMEQTPIDRKREEKSYLRTGYNWEVHRVVWFSFAFYALENPDEFKGLFPNYYGIPIEQIEKPANLKILTGQKVRRGKGAKKKKAKKDKKIAIEIHHINGNPKNNCIEELEALPEDIHKILHEIADTKDEFTRLKAVHDNFDEKVAVSVDNGIYARKYNRIILKKEAVEDLQKQKTIVYIVNEAEKKEGSGYFNDTRYIRLNYGNSRYEYYVIGKDRDKTMAVRINEHEAGRLSIEYVVETKDIIYM